MNIARRRVGGLVWLLLFVSVKELLGDDTLGQCSHGLRSGLSLVYGMEGRCLWCCWDPSCGGVSGQTMVRALPCASF